MVNKWSDRRVLMVGVMGIVALVIIGLFVVDMMHENEILNDTIVGMMIGSSFTALTAYVAYYTTGEENKGAPPPE